jgi:hypothetical protein
VQDRLELDLDSVATHVFQRSFTHEAYRRFSRFANYVVVHWETPVEQVCSPHVPTHADCDALTLVDNVHVFLAHLVLRIVANRIVVFGDTQILTRFESVCQVAVRIWL